MYIAYTIFFVLDQKGENIVLIGFHPFVDSWFRTKRGRKIYCFDFAFIPLLMIDKKREKNLSFRVLYAYLCFYIY